MNYGNPIDPQNQTLAHRPEEIRSLIQLAQQRIEFNREQIDVVTEGLQQLIESHQGILAHYQALVGNDLNLIAQMEQYLAGARMVPDHLPLAYAPGNEPQLLHAAHAPALAPSPADAAKKAEVLAHFNSPGDHKPVADPSPQYNGKTRHQVVAEATPLPQASVAVVQYEEGEELPPEALPGHMKAEPRTAQQLQVELAARRNGNGVHGKVIAQVVDAPPANAVVVEDEIAPPPPATTVVVEPPAAKP